MTLQAPAIIDVRPGGIGASEMVAWLRGIGVRQVRIACGLVMFSLHLLAFLQSCARQHLLRDHGSMAVVPRLVVANSDRQLHALRRGCDAFRRSACGRSISGGIFATRPPRSRSSCWASAFRCCSPVISEACASAASCSTAIRPLMQLPLFGLLGFPAAHDRGAVRAADGGVDARLHRTLFLAAAEAIFQMGGAHPARHSGTAAAACDDRRSSRRARGRSSSPSSRNGAPRI